MTQKQVTVLNPSGLHARPAAEFVKAAAGFGCGVFIRMAGQEDAVNAKSIIRVLSLAAEQGSQVVISADGEGEAAAVETLAALIEGGFGEL